MAAEAEKVATESEAEHMANEAKEEAEAASKKLQNN
jgi:hypothetical protein